MPRIKSDPRCITYYTEKRYMNHVFTERDVSPANTPRRNSNNSDSIVDSLFNSTPDDSYSKAGSKVKPEPPNAPSKQKKLFQHRERIILDIHGPYEDLKDICGLLRTLPCMDNNNIIIELSRINEEDNYHDEEDVFTDRGRVLIVTFFRNVSNEFFLIKQLLEAKEIYEDYMLVDDGTDTMRNFPTYRYFWS